MSCSKWRIDIALYVGGDLPVKRVARTVAHLEACAECRALADDLRAGQTLLSELRDESLEDIMAANVRRRVLARLPVKETGVARRYWAWALAAALLLATILTLPRRTVRPAPIARRQIAPPHIADTPPAIVNVRRPAVRRHRRATPQPSEPLLVQLVTDDPNIVIYWLVDPKPQGD
jgi:hypothetical protein